MRKSLLNFLFASSVLALTMATVAPLSVNAETTDTICQEAADLIDLNVDLANLVDTFRLPAKGQYGVKFAWDSSNAAITIDEDSVSGYPLATIVRNKTKDVTGNLTVTAYLLNHTSAAKTFACTVLKDTGTTPTALPVHWEEDFSSYETGIELANYDKWQCSSLEGGEATVVEKLATNINESPSTKMLSCQSVRSSTNLTYSRAANIAATDNQNGAVLEGDVLYTGETNGFAVEIVNSAKKVIAGFQLSPNGYALNFNGTYLNGAALKPTEGVWEHFRLFFKPNVGQSWLYVYDWLTSAWVDVMTGTPLSKTATYDPASGITAEAAGSGTAVRLNLAKGSLFGTTYVANIRIDKIADFPEATPTNHNRSVGLGEVTGYKKTLFGFEGESLEGLNPDFLVTNRFQPSVTLTKNTDYTITTSSSSDEDGATIYSYLFALTATGETKAITQTAYITNKTTLPILKDFRGSSLKKIDDDTGYINITALAYRGDLTLYWALLGANSAAPTVEEVENGTATGTVAYASSVIADHEVSLKSGSLPLNQEYDLYGFVKATSGSSVLYSSKSLSTIVNLTTPEDFHNMSSDLSTLGSTFRLLNDIDFSAYYWAFDGASRSFTGTLEGNGHTVKNLTISNASDDKSIKSGLFFNFNGTVENLTFDHCRVEGFADVGLLGGNAYGCTVKNCAFIDCSSVLESTLAGGDGYFGLLVGRCRGKDNLFENIEVRGAVVEGNQRCGLLVGGTEAASYDVTVDFENIAVQGSVSEAGGAQAGLMGRNYSKSMTSTLIVNNALIELEVIASKKEVGTVLGRNEGGSKVVANNVYGDLTIKELDQTGYFGQFIGYDVSATSNYKSFAFQGTNMFYLDNDYSGLGDNIVQNKNAVDGGTMVPVSEEKSQRWWETQTWLKDLDTSKTFAYDEGLSKPVISLRDDLGLTAASFTKWVDLLDEKDLLSCHYPLYKAADVLALLSDTEKNAIPAEKMSTYERVKKAYEELVAQVGQTSAF